MAGGVCHWRSSPLRNGTCGTHAWECLFPEAGLPAAMEQAVCEAGLLGCFSCSPSRVPCVLTVFNAPLMCFDFIDTNLMNGA